MQYGAEKDRMISFSIVLLGVLVLMVVVGVVVGIIALITSSRRDE